MSASDVSGSEPEARPPVACRLTRSEALVVAAVRYAGPASAVGEAFDHLLRWAEVHNVERWGPLVGVYDDVEDPEARLVEGEAWLPIPSGQRDIEPHDPQVTVLEVPAEPVAVCEHRGYPDELGRSMGALVSWVVAKGLERSRPIHRQVYREAPRGGPGEWVVEIQIPVLAPPAGFHVGAETGDCDA